jgi:hypothetical protein
MCILYFACHQHCLHSHFLGHWPCDCDCLAPARHSFYIEDTSDCTTCVRADRKKLDPEVVPVKYYPPGESFGVRLNKGYGMCSVERTMEKEEGREKEEDGGKEEDEEKDYASLSDVDSDTSEWRQDHSNEPETPHTQRTHQATPRTTPNTRAHRNLVQNQLNQLPTRIATQAGDVFRTQAKGAWPPKGPAVWPGRRNGAPKAMRKPWGVPAERRG